MSSLPATQEEPRGSIKALLGKPEVQARFKEIVPQHLSPQRMLRVMALAVHKTPKLGLCSPMSLLGAMQVSGSLGLEPNTPLGHAYLVPYKVKRQDPATNRWAETYDVNLIIGYRGYIDLARRSGSLVNIHADIVFAGDDFDFAYGTKQRLDHRPGVDQGAPEWGYCYAKLRGGDSFEVLPYSKALEARGFSEAYRSAMRYGNNDTPWIAHEHAMVQKTMVRRLAKWLPMSLEFATAAKLDLMSEGAKIDFSAFADGRADIDDPDSAEQLPPPRSPDHDEDTGEVGKDPILAGPGQGDDDGQQTS